MKNIIAIGIVGFLSIHFLHAQSKFKSNGPNNLQSICTDKSVCIYVEIPSIITFPEIGDGKKQWELHNLEIVAKKTTGHFIVTGDLGILSVDTAALISFEIQFFDSKDQLLYSHQVKDYEFYNEPKHAEPILIADVLNSEVAEVVEYIGIDFSGSRLIPYYEMKSSCYHACKTHKLNEAIRAFKKAK